MSLCAQMMKQRRRGLGDIVSSTIPEVDGGDSNANRVKVNNVNQNAPSTSTALPVLHRGVKVEAPNGQGKKHRWRSLRSLRSLVPILVSIVNPIQYSIQSVRPVFNCIKVSVTI